MATATKTPKKQITAKEVRNMLRNKLSKRNDAVPMPQHAVLFEVPVDGVRRKEMVSSDGDTIIYDERVRRRIDAVSVGLWQRTEHLIQGFEIKVSRADLLSELKDLNKSAPAIALVDRWWLVLGDAKILKDTDEVPEGWGIMVVRGRGLSIVREAAPTGSAPDNRFIAALLQSAIGGRGGITRAIGSIEGYSKGLAYGKLQGHSEGYYQGLREGYTQGREVASKSG